MFKRARVCGPFFCDQSKWKFFFHEKQEIRESFDPKKNLTERVAVGRAKIA